jgi:hypothetical protein
MIKLSLKTAACQLVILSAHLQTAGLVSGSLLKGYLQRKAERNSVILSEM